VDPRKPCVELVLEVEVAGESAARLEVRLRIALQPPDRALGLRVGRLAEAPGDLQLAAERGERLRRPAGMAVDARLAIPDQLLRQRPQPDQAAGDPSEQIFGLLAEDEHPGAGARVA